MLDKGEALETFYSFLKTALLIVQPFVFFFNTPELWCWGIYEISLEDPFACFCFVFYLALILTLLTFTGTEVPYIWEMERNFDEW